MPPVFCASAITCRVIVVLPEDSGPKTSTTRPRGKPPTPSAASKEMAPVEITEIGTMASFEPSRMIRSEEHTSELQSLRHLVCRLLLEKKNLAQLGGGGARYAANLSSVIG